MKYLPLLRQFLAYIASIRRINGANVGAISFSTQFHPDCSFRAKFSGDCLIRWKANWDLRNGTITHFDFNWIPRAVFSEKQTQTKSQSIPSKTHENEKRKAIKNRCKIGKNVSPNGRLVGTTGTGPSIGIRLFVLRENLFKKSLTKLSEWLGVSERETTSNFTRCDGVEWANLFDSFKSLLKDKRSDGFKFKANVYFCRPSRARRAFTEGYERYLSEIWFKRGRIILKLSSPQPEISPDRRDDISSFRLIEVSLYICRVDVTIGMI